MCKRGIGALLFLMIVLHWNLPAVYSMEGFLGEHTLSAFQKGLSIAKNANDSIQQFLEKEAQTIRQLKIHIDGIVPSSENQDSIRSSYAQLFSFFEKDFLAMKQTQKEKVLEELLMYVEKNQRTRSAFIKFLGDICGSPGLSFKNVRTTSQEVARSISNETLYYDCTRGLSLLELEMITRSGLFINKHNMGTFAFGDLGDGLEYQGGNILDGRRQGREVIVKIRAPRYLMMIAQPYGDLSLVHFGDASEAYANEYIKELEDIRNRLENEMRAKQETMVEKRQNIKSKLANKKGAEKRKALRASMAVADYASFEDAEKALKVIKILNNKIQDLKSGAKNDLGILSARFVDWGATIAFNEKRFNKVEYEGTEYQYSEKERFDEKIRPLLDMASAKYSQARLAIRETYALSSIPSDSTLVNIEVDFITSA